MAQHKVLLNRVKSKLSLLTSHKDELQGKLDTYIDKVTTQAKIATEADKQDMTAINQVNIMLETALVFLLGLDAQVDDATSESIEVESGSATSTEDKSQALETSLADALRDQDSRLRAVEDLMSQTNTKLSTKIEELDARITLQIQQKSQQLEKKCANTEEQYNTRLDDMRAKYADVIKQSDSRLDKVEKKVKKLEAGGKEDGSRLENLVKEVESLKNKYSKRQQSTKLDNLEERVQTLSSQYSSFQDQLADVQKLKQTTENCVCKLDTMVDKGDLLDVMKTARTMSKSIQEMSARIDVTESFVKSYELYKQKDENTKKELDHRVAVVESNHTSQLNWYSTKLEDVENRYQQVCQIVDERVTPLHRLLRILNDLHKNVESREDISLRLDEVTKKLTDISTNLSTLDKKFQQGAVGFSAFTSARSSVTKDVVIKHFSNVLCNEGGHYDNSTGMFTAPKDGFCIASVTHGQKDTGEIVLNVYHKKASGTGNKAFCWSGTGMEKTSSCGVGVTCLKAGDQIYVSAFKVTGDVKFFGTFCCCFLA